MSPPRAVLDAFGCAGTATALSGGQNQSFKCSDAVLKPVEDGVEAEWAANVFAQLSASPKDGFRIPTPIRASNSQFVYQGWTAYRFVSGVTGPLGKWEKLLNTSRSFHATLLDVDCPSFLDSRSHPWAVADRVAWEEAHVEVVPCLQKIYSRLCSMREKLVMRSQIIHGDLSGNVLFDSNGAAPALIDFSPFWRPVEYSEAILLVDGILYFGQGAALLEICNGSLNLHQMLVKAALFRLLARNSLVGLFGEITVDKVNSFEKLLLVILQVKPASISSY
ncbi:hypothetical protein B7463_g12398, partial [Scytalidium lignicola]